MAKRKIRIGDQEVMAEEIEFEAPEGEKWNKYILHDGTELKLKAIVADIFRVDGQYTPAGEPLYSVNASLIVNTNAPEHLRRK
jgi:hypothetical protein